MTERIWDKYWSDTDRAVYEKIGIGRRVGFGKRPALLIIDVSYGFCGEKDVPQLKSVEQWSLSCGPESWGAVEQIARLRQACDAKGMPVIYTTGIRRDDGWDLGGWAWKNVSNGARTVRNGRNITHHTIVDELAPRDTDVVIYKQKPSAFFGTNLTSYLTLLGCDSVIVTGVATSGCVRATVVDAFSLNYRVVVPEEACFDRAAANHAMSLCDIDTVYGDVLPTDDVISHINGMEPGQFNLPAGRSPAAA